MTDQNTMLFYREILFPIEYISKENLYTL